MIYKLQTIFNKLTADNHNLLINHQQLHDLLKKLVDRKIFIEQDIFLIEKYIIDFPCNFEQFCCYLKNIFKLDIENSLNKQITNFDETLGKISQFLIFYSHDNPNNFNNEDLYEILKNLKFSLENLDESVKNIKKVDLLIKNIRDDIQKFLWDGIYENKNLDNDNKFPYEDADDYQTKMKERINYEYEIIKTKRIHYNSEKAKLIRKIKKVLVEKAICSDREIMIQTWKIPNNYFDKELLENFYNKCEALKELILSKYFQKFTGFDDLSYDDYQIYFFENIEGVNLLHYIMQNSLSTSESSFFFRYISKEILLMFRDLLYKNTHSFIIPIKLENMCFELNQNRLYIESIEFGPRRKTILNSKQIVEAKLLYAYALIIIQLLSYDKLELTDLHHKISKICENFQEFDQMQKIFEHIFYIEEVLNKNIEDDILISIIIECLISPYKAKIVFDEFYENKNFIKEIFLNYEKEKFSKSDNQDLRKGPNPPQEKIPDVKFDDNLIQENRDKFILLQPYYEENKNEIINENFNKKILTLNLLLQHPFYTQINFDDSYVSYLFNNKSNY